MRLHPWHGRCFFRIRGAVRLFAGQRAETRQDRSAAAKAEARDATRLTHLSLTGVQAFLREDLIVFCREAPPGLSSPPALCPPSLMTRAEFNEHQRDVFCVFSGVGVARLRGYLNADAPNRRPSVFEQATMFHDDGAETDMMLNVTSQANEMGIEDMDDDFGESSDILGRD